MLILVLSASRGMIVGRRLAICFVGRKLRLAVADCGFMQHSGILRFECMHRGALGVDTAS